MEVLLTYIKLVPLNMTLISIKDIILTKKLWML